ncbi:predicted protein [Sclerotinia sclerotiorum 1980 UF-70]|uniref:Uncharacterized protein n=1 Tax=Sclerotinia sclerotiorum (strain ATCC 18683 / 1980 / Ss-1) TaxID=665079 RepID=A7EIM8_SCLS1|nr:predicted protein [Sclerotinia sclerotiorum 1980 UF-70]EDO02694.1 predicted protein [Sclerotinia sclerotiorum 1980 UF-70]
MDASSKDTLNHAKDFPVFDGQQRWESWKAASILGDDTWVSIGTGIDLPCGFVGFEYLREYFKLRVHTPIHSSVLTIYSSLFG